MNELFAIQCACDHESAKVDVLAGFLAVSDELVAKAATVPELVRMARIEVSLREYLLTKWRVRSKWAARAAASAYAQGLGLVGAQIACDAIMVKYQEDVQKRFELDVARCYKLGRTSAWKKAAGHSSAPLRYHVPGSSESAQPVQKAKPPKKPGVAADPTFSLVDEKAIAELQKEMLVWIGSHYDRRVRELIAQVLTNELIAGHGQVEAARAVRAAIQRELGYVKLPNRAKGNEKTYFEGLAANTATNARVRGSIASFAELEITTYEIVNPMDDQTTAFCAWMNGKQFQVTDAVSHIQRISGATSPAEVKRLHPWLDFEDLKKISSGPGHQSAKESQSLAQLGLALPPYHWLCRTTIDAVG